MWTKLEMGDDWGHLFWKIEDDATTHNRDKQEVLLPRTVNVRWPDGRETTERLVSRQYHDMVSDMGRSYPVSGSYPVIER